MTLIDRDAYKQELEKAIYRCLRMTGRPDLVVLMTLNYAVEKLDSAPVVEAVPVRHARLVNASPYGECSCCGELIDSRDRFRYCPHCGARIVGEGDKDESY